jgi:hypothetical protein
MKIESLFPLNIANLILETPLFNMIADDKLIWIDSPQGTYSVKSGYKLLCNFSGRVDVAASHDDWSSLWKINAPPKAKHLLWRICRGCLPTRVRLQDRHVPCPIACPLCDYETEDDWHILCDCVVSLQVRQAAGIDQRLLPRIQSAGNVREFIFNVCTQEDKDVAGIFAMVVWILWNNRHNKVWNEMHDPGRTLGFKARHLWEEWAAVQQLKRASAGAASALQTQQMLHWRMYLP